MKNKALRKRASTRRHLCYVTRKTGRWPFRSTRVLLVNTADLKTINEAPTMPEAATTSTRDIRGHGRGTSRCKRAQRDALASLGADLAAYPVPREQGKSWFGRIAEAMALPPRMMNPLA